MYHNGNAVRGRLTKSGSGVGWSAKNSCKGPRCLIRTGFQGCMRIPAGSGGGVEYSSEDGALSPRLVDLIATLGRPRMPRMREVARPAEAGAGCST
jgi:hypothetical protein